MSPASLRRPSGRTQVFGSLLAMVFLVNLGRVIYAPLLEPFRTTFGASEAAVGLLATLAWIGSASLRLPTGYLLTKIPRHRIVLVTGLILTASAIFAATAQTLEILYLGALAMGMASGMYFVAANPLVSELFPTRVGRMIGIHGTSSQLASVAAPLLVAGYFLIVWPIAAWRVVFLTIAAVALCSTFALYVTARRTELPDAGMADRRLRTALRTQWQIVITAVAVMSFVGLVWNGVFNFYVSFLVETRGFSQGRAQVFLTLLFATGVPAFFFTGRIADRVRFLPLLFAIMGAFSLALLGLTVVDSLVGIIAMTAITGYVIHSMFPAIDTYLLASLPDDSRGSSYALYSSATMPIQAFGSVILGTLLGTGLGYHSVFRGFAVGVALVLFVLIACYSAGWLPQGDNS
ncbi:MFS transporter [Natrialbaceae archaeon A-CW2]|uniref:MFS transporter n=1 Tax=Natronosalvus amylolyticus TaxID=2961994 RepID=UPI0020CA02EC|nr:MFS transporter [Natronosalvus amylolyticus]